MHVTRGATRQGAQLIPLDLELERTVRRRRRHNRNMMNGKEEVDSLTMLNAKLDALSKSMDKMSVNTITSLYSSYELCHGGHSTIENDARTVNRECELCE